MCRMLEVSRSGYHQWVKHKPTASQQWRQELKVLIHNIHLEHAGRYGAPRITAELNAIGVQCNRKTVARIMKQQQIRAIMARGFVPRTTDSNHDLAIAPNVLGQDFSASAPNQKWVADITYVATSQGWLYLAAVKDLYSRKIVGWSMADHMRADLVCDALTMAIRQECPGPELIHHSDRGVQYACEQFRQTLQRHRITCSMSRKGNCYDNASMESFWATYKQELAYPAGFQHKTKEQVTLATFRYIELYYNRQRRHSALGYMSPQQYHQPSTCGWAA